MSDLSVKQGLQHKDLATCCTDEGEIWHGGRCVCVAKLHFVLNGRYDQLRCSVDWKHRGLQMFSETLYWRLWLRTGAC